MMKSIELHRRLTQLQSRLTNVRALYDAEYMKPEHWEHDKDKRLTSPMRPTPEGERRFSELGDILRRLESQVTELKRQLKMK